MSLTEHHHHHPAKLWDWPLEANDGNVQVKQNYRSFEVSLDARSFTAKEISVKVLGDQVEVRMEHDNKTDAYGSISRCITRTYTLPENVDPNSIRSELNDNGHLIIHGLKK